MKKVLALLLISVLILPVCFFVDAQAASREITVLFTHDLHSHLLPVTDTEGGEFGGYARLMTVINEQRAKHPDAILVDGGDFSMGSLFQTAFTTSAIELRMMGAMGYDVTTLGNHEFDYLPAGLTAMLNTAAASGEKTPEIVISNYLPMDSDVDIKEAYNNYGVKSYTIIERGGVYFVIFGIFGEDADECAPNSGMVRVDPVKVARETVAQATEECKEKYNADPVVICLSHSGTDAEGNGEDYELAEAVDGIDLIIAAHTHITLHDVVTVNGTNIVAASEYGKYLGVVCFDKDKNLTSYELIAVDENVAEDPVIAAKVENFKQNVNTEYLANYGVSYDEVIVNNQIEFETIDEIYATQHESTLGNLFSDAYKWAAEKTSGERVDAALTATGVIRETIPTGEVTVADVFTSASLGVGTEGELIAVYITGRELKNAMEVDASVQPLMRYAQLFFSGVEYSFNTNRMIFNKVDYAMLRTDEGLVEIEDDKLYRVVTGMYAGQMLGAVESKSYGLISIIPKDKDGNPIASDELVNYVIKDENGVPLKEWYAITSYIQNMGGEMDSAYASTDGRKVVYSSLNPVKLVRNANKFTYILIAVIVIVIAVITLALVVIIKRIKNKKKSVA
ncbi:MAG: bifunctional metallophosphatase/5'-nucleotidase [Clostridia bacterium]|nr:bifunctional metallophosphatase/5'-nucleotidase [Clostridia bacterium]